MLQVRWSHVALFLLLLLTDSSFDCLLPLPSIACTSTGFDSSSSTGKVNYGFATITSTRTRSGMLVTGNVLQIFPKVFNIFFRRGKEGVVRLSLQDRTDDKTSQSLIALQDTVVRLNYEVSCLKTQVLRYKKDVIVLRRDKATLRQVYEDKLKALEVDYQTQLETLQETLQDDWAEEKEELVSTMRQAFEAEKTKLQEELQAIFALEREALKKELSVLQISSDQSIKTIEELKVQLKKNKDELASNQLVLKEQQQQHVKTVAELREQLKVQQTAANAYAAKAAAVDVQQEEAKRSLEEARRVRSMGNSAAPSTTFTAGKPSRSGRRSSRSNKK